MFRITTFIILTNLIITHAFANSQYTDILIEGEVKSHKSYWTINPVNFSPLKILSKVGLQVKKATPLTRTPVENDDLVDGKITYVGKGYRLDPISLDDSNLATKLAIRDILKKKDTQMFEWGAAPEANQLIYKASKPFSGKSGLTRFRGVLKIETYKVDGKTEIYSKLDVVEIEQNDEHYKNLFLRELFTKKALQKANFEELYK